MFGKAINFNTNRKGAAIVWVVILFTIIVILTTSVIYIARQNTFETVKQEERIRAYYLSLSGIEIGYAALMAPDGSPGPKYINRFNASKSDVTNTQTIKDGVKTIGTVDITIGNVTIGGKRWIQVKSIGTLADSTVSVSSSLRIDSTNHEIIIRDQFGK